MSATAANSQALKDAQDTLSYAMGTYFGQQIIETMRQMPFDTIDAGVMAKAFAESKLQPRFVEMMTEEMGPISETTFMTALRTTLGGKEGAMNADAAAEYVEKTAMSHQEAKRVEMAAEGRAYLDSYGKQEGVVTTGSGLMYKVITAGTGAKPTEDDRVRCHYKGMLTDGTVFDSSYDRGEPIDFPVTGVIEGWTEALQLMPTGSKWEVVIPYELGYGERGAGGAIPPYSTLIFEIELLEILK